MSQINLKDRRKKATDALKFSILEILDLPDLENKVKEMNDTIKFWGVDSYSNDDIFTLRDEGKHIALEEGNGIKVAMFSFLGERRNKIQCIKIIAAYSNDGQYHSIDGVEWVNY